MPCEEMNFTFWMKPSWMSPLTFARATRKNDMIAKHEPTAMSHCCVTSSARKCTRTGALEPIETSLPLSWRTTTSAWRTNIAPTPTRARSAIARRRNLSRRPGTSPSVQFSNSSENTMTSTAVAA